MKFLDLFCCCGGISKGFKLAYPDAEEITGIDITPDHNYPFNFICGDVFSLDPDFFKQFDLIHASPPCQHYTWATKKNVRHRYPDLVERTRNLLKKTGKPFVIENVIGAPVRKDLVLCGEMFGLRVLRHRIFEIEGFTVLQPPHIKHKPPVSKGKSYYMQVAGHGGQSYSFRIEDWQKAMGIEWVNDKEHLTQMIPPEYYRYIVSNIF